MVFEAVQQLAGCNMSIQSSRPVENLAVWAEYFSLLGLGFRLRNYIHDGFERIDLEGHTPSEVKFEGKALP